MTTFRRPSYFAGSGFLQSQRRTSTEHLKRRKCSGFPLLFHLTARAGPAQPKHGELCGERAARGGALGGAACHTGWPGGAPELPQGSPRAPQLSGQKQSVRRHQRQKIGYVRMWQFLQIHSFICDLSIIALIRFALFVPAR